MRRSLYGKLVAVLVGIFLLIGLFTVLLTLFATRLYLAEVNQTVNRSLASQLVSEEPLMKGGQIDPGALKALFTRLMVINPGIEVYVLDPGGRILAFSAPPGRVRRDRVAMGPVRALLSGTAPLPILGDDPRGRVRRKVFSVAPIGQAPAVDGYLYVILGGEEFDGATRFLQGSYILRLTLWTAGGCLLFAFLVAVFLFRLLTRRLDRLARDMEVFQQGDFSGEIGASELPDPQNSDEIDRLRGTFRQMSDRIREQVGRLRETDTFRREMVANVSHDFRTPLTALQGYLETLLLKEGRLTPEEQKHYLEIAFRQTGRLASMVSELFLLAKLDSHEWVPRPEVFSMEDLVSDIARKFQPGAVERGLVIVTEFSPGVPPALADIGMVERVLENLVGNALDHTPSGGRIVLAVEPRDGRVGVRVRDTGRGIAPELIPTLFQRFTRGERDRSEAPDGAGLGLAIVKRILDLHECRIAVKSAPEQGAEFVFDLPAAPSS